jgi:hypothetical protein
VPKIAPYSDPEAPPSPCDLLKDFNAKMGLVPNIFSTKGHAQEVLQATPNLNATIQKELPAK